MADRGFVAGLAASALIAACALSAGCGKKGPPLPPLVKLPAAPADFTAQRRGDLVDLQFTVPAANTDNTKPANIERVDVYGLTSAAPAAMTDADLFKYGTRIGSVDVKAPRNPDDTAEADESASEVEAPTGKGLDQGSRAHLDEAIAPDALKPVEIAPAKRKGDTDGEGPLLGPSMTPPSRTYVGVGITTRGRKGATSRRIAVPLLAPPPAPAAPTITYTESAITVRWTNPETSPEGGVLPARLIGTTQPTLAFNVYDVSEGKPAGGDAAAPDKPAPTAAPAGGETRLTTSPVASTEYSDSRMTWGAERCYAVRAAETVGGTTIESDPSPKGCVKLTDTFPPAAPKQLTAVASEGSISLIWDPNGEPDLAGYIVLRGTSADDLKPITPSPIVETTFKDSVEAGTKYVYAVKAVDKAGNVSAPSNNAEETAR